MQGVGNFAVLKKHFASFVTGFDGAKELRMQLMNANDPQTTLAILNAAL
jgi:tRNA-dihydrouridine synthase